MVGKIFGALIGFRLAGPVGAVVGAVIGHFGFDELRAKKADRKPNSQVYQDHESPNTLSQAYAALGLKPNASIREVKSAYRKKCKELHPDVLQNKGLGESAMKALEAELRRVTEAYETILEFRDAKN